ncbi:MAG: redoxin domain-containing protein [bacterium]|nr:redoxin domain-containing protein [bacterium]
MNIQIGDEGPLFSELIEKSKKFYRTEQLEKGLLIFFYKVSCPTCQYAAPFINRFFLNGVPVLGICQNPQLEKKVTFEREFRLNFPSINESDGYHYSNAYNISVVPTIFTFTHRGIINDRIEAFDKKKYEILAQNYSISNLFLTNESVLDFKPG